MNRKIIAFVLSLALLATSGCAGVQINIKEKNGSPETGGGKPWIDSELKENISEDTPTDPKDDFYLYVNKDWILANEIPAGYPRWTHFDERDLEVKDQCIKLLSDDSLKGHDAKLIRTYNDLILDWDARNAAGVSGIKDMYEDILAVKDTKDLTGLLTDPERSYMLFSFADIGTTVGLNDPDTCMAGVVTPSLILRDSAEYKNRTELGDMYYGYNKEMFTYLAQKMGMSREDAEKCFENAIEIETALSDNIYTLREQNSADYLDRINNEMSLAETVALAKVFPLGEMIASRGYDYDGPFIVNRPDYFKKLDELYTDENAEGLRDLVLVRYLLNSSGDLDKETYDKGNELVSSYFGISGAMPDDEMACSRVRSMLPASMQKVYISKYGSDEDKQKMTDLCQEVIDTYREMLSENEWASDEVKAQAIEKLDRITIHAAYPDKLRDTSDIDLAGCSLIEANRKLARIEKEHDRKLLGMKKDKEMWAEGFDILSCNAFYDPNDNTINMTIGMMGEPFYNSNMSTEELYASIVGFWVGHEISHAFDSNGSQIDAQGRLRDWWTPEDKEEFNRRIDRMDDYLDGIIAFGVKHFIGSNIDTEMVADITGVQCALRMASKVEGFDYDRFFVKNAELYAGVSTYSSELSVLLQDSHPLDYSRVNVPMQQFEEFYETYDIKEGDNMYLAPEDRLLVW